MAVSAMEIAEVAEVNLQGLEAFKRFVLRINRLQAVFEWWQHLLYVTPFMVRIFA